MHGAEVYSVCSMDFIIANNLSKLYVMGVALSNDTIDHVAESQFASIKATSVDTESYFENGFPMECHGLQSAENKFILRALIDSKDSSIEATTTVVGMSCFSGRNEPATRPYAIPHLKTLLEL